jgi:hypothetical protein
MAGRVRDDAFAFAPEVQLEGRRLEDEARGRIVGEVESHLVGRAGRGRSDRPAEALHDGPVQVTRNHALDLRMAGDHVLQRLRVREGHGVHVPDPGPEGRMVQRDDRR